MNAFRLWLCLVSCIALMSALSAADILFNQVGYYANQSKLLFAADSTATSFEIVEVGSNQSVYTGDLGASETYSDGGIEVRSGDFSALTSEGSFYIRLGDGTESASFKIGSTVHREGFLAALKGLYFARATQEITSEFGGEYARPLGHPDDDVRYHSSTGKADGVAAAPKGWYDAGDFGKYIVNGGYALGTLLSLYELNPNLIGDNTGIPESLNGVSDLLDECRWEIEWFLAMQDNDGGVFHKLTTQFFVGTIMPHTSNAQRYFVGKSTTATLNFAATMAQAARVYESIDPTLSATCLAASERAWDWAEANPSEIFTNPGEDSDPDRVRTGEYGDSNPSDEFVWASAQLYITTGDSTYLPRLADQLANPNVDSAASWLNIRNLGLYSLATLESGISSIERTRIQNAIISRADQLITTLENNTIRIPMTNFAWGSSGAIAARGVLLSYAYTITQDRRYLRNLIHIADYLMGRNATTYSFLTGYGSNTPMHIHHRASAADGIVEPVPGLLAGGPNSVRQDANNVNYTYTEPARSYMDVYPSYASNEIAVNWNTPFIFMMGVLEYGMDPDFNSSDPVSDNYRFPSGEPIAVGASEGLLSNDPRPSEAEGVFAVELVTPPAFGDLDLASDGSFTYTPADDYLGNVYFEYKTFSETTESEAVTVTLAISPESTDLISDLFGSSLVLWLDATRIAPENTEEVSASLVVQWTDRSQYGNHAANADEATRPQYASDGINNRPAVSFGSNTTLLEVGDLVAEPGETTAFVVSKSDFSEGDDFQRMVGGYSGSGNNWEAPNYFISHPSLEGSSYSYAPQITRQENSDRALVNVTVGAQTDGINPFSGTIGEVIIISRSLTGEEVSEVESFLATKWQIGRPSSDVPIGYEAWLWNYPSLSLSDSESNADPNGNGLSNYFEYLFGNDPTAPSRHDKFAMSLDENGYAVLEIDTWSDFLLRDIEFDLEYTPDLANPDWKLAGDGDNIDFEVDRSTASNRSGFSTVSLKSDAKVDGPMFVRIRKI